MSRLARIFMFLCVFCSISQAQSWDYLGNRLYRNSNLRFTSFGDTLVGIGAPNLIFVGDSWSSLSQYAPPGDARPIQLARIDKNFIVLTDSSYLYHSTDLKHWSIVRPTNRIKKVVVFKKNFVGITNAGIAISTDGVVWSYKTPIQTWNPDALEGKGTLVTPNISAIVGTDAAVFAYQFGLRYAMKSTDLANWTKDTILCSECSFQSYNPDEFVAKNNEIWGVNLSDTILYHSTDGSHWEKSGITDYTDVASISLTNGILRIDGCKTTTLPIECGAKQSTDGITWTKSETSFGKVSYYKGSYFYPLNDSLMKSTDGIKWQKETEEVQSMPSMKKISHFNGQFIGIGMGAYSSNDGVSWSKTNSFNNIEHTEICNSSTLLVSIGKSGSIFTSANGTVWTARSSATQDDLIGVRWTGSFFLAWGDSIIIQSTDGTTWSKLPNFVKPLDKIWSVQWTGALYLSVIGGVLYTTNDGSAWTEVDVGIDYNYNRWFNGFYDYKDSLLLDVGFAGPGSSYPEIWLSSKTSEWNKWATHYSGISTIYCFKFMGDSSYISQSRYEEGSRVLASTDFHSWKEFPTKLSHRAISFAKGSGKFLALLSNGQLAVWNPLYPNPVKVLAPKRIKETEGISFHNGFLSWYNSQAAEVEVILVQANGNHIVIQPKNLMQSGLQFAPIPTTVPSGSYIVQIRSGKQKRSRVIQIH